MILERISVPRLQQVEVSHLLALIHGHTLIGSQDLDATTRGEGGFGSTGGFGPASKKQKTENGDVAEQNGDAEKKA